MDYADMDDKELLDALRVAGRVPDRALVQEALDRYEQLAPDLRTMLVAEGDDDWEDDDPLWYQNVHAGLILLAKRDRESIPLFVEIVSKEAWEPLDEWFNVHLHHYGPVIVEPLIAVLTDEDAEPWGRIGTVEILTNIAEIYPETRQTVRSALRSVLPPLQEDGTVDVTDPSEDEIVLWTFAAEGLGGLKDRKSLPVVEALHKQDLIDEMVYGDFEEYQTVYFQPDRLRISTSKPSAYDIFEVYGYDRRQ